MTAFDSESLTSGKGHTDENFPVASWLIRPELRGTILTFYRFARAADDIADHETASEATKLAQLARMRAGLDGDGTAEAMEAPDGRFRIGVQWHPEMRTEQALFRGLVEAAAG